MNAKAPITPFSHGTPLAHESAAKIGFSTTNRDFRDAFLSIADAVLGKPSTARYLGPTRDAERWAIILCGRDVEVIYNPERAVIRLVLSPRRPDGAALARAVAP